MYEHNGAFMATSHVGGIMPYNCILICFDLCGNTGKNPREYNFSTPQPYQPYYRNPVLDTIPSVFHPGDDGIRLLFETILRLHVSDGDSARLQEKSCMLQLLNRLYLAAHFPAGGDGDNNADPDGRIRQMMMYIQSHLAEPLSLDTLASMAGLSPAHFHKIFTRVVREPLNAYVTRLRMEKARGLLVGTNLPAHQIGADCGYPNPSHFGWLFRKWNGLSPGEYKRLHRYA
jgi:AraC-like DNA-binding protein